MTYYSGVGKSLGEASSGPYVECDRCRSVVLCTTRKRSLAAWMRKNQPPPGWVRLRDAQKIFDYCQTCWTRETQNWKTNEAAE